MQKIFTRQVLQLSFIWTLVALVPAGRAYLFLPWQVWFDVLILVAGLLFCPLLVLWIRFLWRKRQSWVVLVLIQLGVSVAAGITAHFATEESYPLKRRINPTELSQLPGLKKITAFVFTGNSYTVFTSFMILCSLALLLEYNEQIKQRKNKEAELKVSLVVSQIKALQSELQPHFIFNTLNSASSLMEFDIDKAQQLLERFSFLMRNYLDIINQQFYTLADEVNFLNQYIQIQQLRHNGEIIMDIDVTENCLQIKVPVILLQPLIENSIKHGWLDRKKELHIVITVSFKDDMLCITVKDNGQPTVLQILPGTGIRNLKERLAVLYHDNFTFTEYSNYGYISTITFPAKP